MLPTRIILVARRQALVDPWNEVFESFDSVEVYNGDFFTHDADAMMSPANSFGIMDGGLDAAIRSLLGFQIESEVQAVILEKHHGELPVGTAEIIPTGHSRWKYLVVAPTMRVPESVADTLNAYLSFRAALLSVMRHNRTSGGSRIDSLLAPGLCTGVGRMDARRCAAQMRVAYATLSKPPRIPSYSMIHEVHRKLCSAF